jgi:hypothetical protein
MMKNRKIEAADIEATVLIVDTLSEMIKPYTENTSMAKLSNKIAMI